jgi:hypothetical protein
MQVCLPVWLLGLIAGGSALEALRRLLRANGEKKGPDP